MQHYILTTTRETKTYKPANYPWWYAVAEQYQRQNGKIGTEPAGF